MFQNIAKQNKSRVKFITTGGTVGLAEGIVDDTCLVYDYISGFLVLFHSIRANITQRSSMVLTQDVRTDTTCESNELLFSWDLVGQQNLMKSMNAYGKNLMNRTATIFMIFDQ